MAVKDSTILLGILNSHHGTNGDFRTFTSAFPGRAIDEIGYIDRLKQRYDFVNHRTYPSAESAGENLRDFVYVNDEPTTSPSFYSQYEVMRLTRENGITILLDGQGGDEQLRRLSVSARFLLASSYSSC